ncbi:MAG: DUF503 domain-containing protein [Chloroflexi bacterium]|nr:DUF503 domain-containing protein [Chloroflexota bacterium]MYD47960.1 DUF503 domain-containing protein [Chloroflexota bacterium]
MTTSGTSIAGDEVSDEASASLSIVAIANIIYPADLPSSIAIRPTETVMHVGIARISLRLPDSRSLKDRRQVARSLPQRIRSRFNVSVAQDAGADGNAWQSLTLLVSCVSSDANHADAMLAEVVEFIENSRPDLQVLDYGSETISGL